MEKQPEKEITKFQQGILQVLRGSGIPDDKQLKMAQAIEDMFYGNSEQVVLSIKENFILIKMDSDYCVTGTAFPNYPVPWERVAGGFETGKAIIASLYRQQEMQALQEAAQKKPDIVGPGGARIN